MNMAAYRGVYLWEVSREGVGITMKAAGSSLSLLQSCAEKTGCRLEILHRGGLPVFLGRLRKRQVWAAGLLCFAAGLYFLSSFVWAVRIEGNERLSGEALLSACRQMGLRAGVPKRSVDTQAVTDGLLEQFSELSWVSVGVHGTSATIRLAETIEKVERVDKQTPCDIVAAEDGVILQITAERGTPLVAAGDVVKKGDVLISSALTIGLEGEAQRQRGLSRHAFGGTWRRNCPCNMSKPFIAVWRRKTIACFFRIRSWIFCIPMGICSGKGSCFRKGPSAWGM